MQIPGPRWRFQLRRVEPGILHFQGCCLCCSMDQTLSNTSPRAPTRRESSSRHPLGFPGGSDGKESLQCRRPVFSPWVGKIPWRREWLPTPVFLPGEFHGQRSLVGYSPWGCKELDTSEQLSLLPSSLSLLVVPTMSEPPLSLPGQHLPFHPPIPKSPWTGLKSFLKLAPPCMQPSLCSESEA